MLGEFYKLYIETIQRNTSNLVKSARVYSDYLVKLSKIWNLILDWVTSKITRINFMKKTYFWGLILFYQISVL